MNDNSMAQGVLSLGLWFGTSLCHLGLMAYTALRNEDEVCISHTLWSRTRHGKLAARSCIRVMFMVISTAVTHCQGPSLQELQPSLVRAKRLLNTGQGQHLELAGSAD